MAGQEIRAIGGDPSLELIRRHGSFNCANALTAEIDPSFELLILRGARFRGELGQASDKRAADTFDAYQACSAGAAVGGASRWQATRCPASRERSSGSSILQRSNTYGHRVWKRQPVGGLIGLGPSPLRMIRWRAAPGSGTGTAESNACV